MKHVIASLKSGNWKTLLACFLYFDTGFTVWVMFGPLAPFISKQLSLSPAQAGFLVAVPVLQRIDRARDARQSVPVRGRPPARAARHFALGDSLVRSVVAGRADLHAAARARRASWAWAARASPSRCRWRAAVIRRGCRAWCWDSRRPATSAPWWTVSCFRRWRQHFGWQHATAAVLPLLALTAGGRDAVGGGSQRQERQRQRVHLLGFAVSLGGVIGAGLAGKRGLSRTRQGGAAAAAGSGCGGRARGAAAQISGRARASATPGSVMLVYSITFGGFVGMSSYVSLLLTTQYAMSKVDAG